MNLNVHAVHIVNCTIVLHASHSLGITFSPKVILTMHPILEFYPNFMAATIFDSKI